MIMSFRRKLFKEKDSVKVIKTQNHTTRRNSWSYVTIRELQARKHNQFSAIKRLLRKTGFRKDKHFMISNLRYLSLLETKICFKTLNLWKSPKGHEISKKLSRKRWQVINFSPLSSQNSSKNVLKLEPELSFNRFYIWYLKLTSCFKTRTLKLAFSKLQQWSNTKVKKTYKSKKFTLVTRH